MLYKQKIKRLSEDKYFGILTRNGIEEKIRKEKRFFDCVFIDFNNMKRLNEYYGYETVNSKIKRIFQTFRFRKNDIVGRWFSGDEILIILFDSEPELFIKRFETHSSIKFKYKIYRNINYKQFENLKIKRINHEITM